jgi:cytochrome P450
VARFTREPIVLGGAEIPAGEVLHPAVLAANRDALAYRNSRLLHGLVRLPVYVS